MSTAAHRGPGRAPRCANEQRPGPRPATRRGGGGAEREPPAGHVLGGGRLPGARPAGGHGRDRRRPGLVHARHQAGGLPGPGPDPGADPVHLEPRPLPGPAELPDRPAPGEPGRHGHRRPRPARLAGPAGLAGAAAAGRRVGRGPAVPPAGRRALLGRRPGRGRRGLCGQPVRGRGRRDHARAGPLRAAPLAAPHPGQGGAEPGRGLCGRGRGRAVCTRPATGGRRPRGRGAGRPPSPWSSS